MNSQLYAHLAAFDESSEENDNFSSSPGDLANADDGNAKIATPNIESCESSSSIDEKEEILPLLESSIIYLPVIAAFLISSSCNEELIAFLSIATISFGWLVSWQQQHGRLQHNCSTQLTHSPRQQLEGGTLARSSMPQASNFKNLKRDIYDCRTELSRLLGLIGAPPMGGRNILHEQYARLQQVDSDEVLLFDKIEEGDAPGLTSGAIDILENSIADATSSVVSFLEAHVQVVLTIDKALYWVKISSSLHWGLGPYSQCVERVERAAMSRELFRAQRRSAGRRGSHTNIENGESNHVPDQTSKPASSVQLKDVRMDQPQSRIDSTSILALSSARRNIAHVIVKEVNSIVNTLSALDDGIARQRLLNGHANGGDPNDCENDDYGTERQSTHAQHEDYCEHKITNEFLEMPDVIDIAWIKASRKYLANLLAYCVHKLTTWDALRTLLPSSVEDKQEVLVLSLTQPLHALQESMWGARNLREYLVSHLLLDDDQSSRRLGSVRQISSSDGVESEHKFVLPLLRYQKQLCALDAALWSFQQYTYSQDVGSPNDRAVKDSQDNDDQNHQNDDTRVMMLTNYAAKLTWWNQVKEISSACQTLEEEIGNKFFSFSKEDDGQKIEIEHDGSDECSLPINGDRNAAHETQNYEHIKGETATNNELSKKSSLKTTKTLVFSGEGSKAKRTTKKIKSKALVDDASGTNPAGHSTTAPLPIVRDPFAEHLLVRELQNRIRSVAALREEEQVDFSRIEFQAMTGEDEKEHSSSRSTMEADENRVDYVDGRLQETSTWDEANEVGVTKTAVTTNIFLGASGSLLEELKRNIVCPDDDVEDSNEIVMEDNDDAIVGTTSTSTTTAADENDDTTFSYLT